MHALLLAVALAATPTPSSKGRELAKAERWEELYLAYSAADPTAYSKAERKELGAFLVKGARALQKDDAIMAYSLAELAVGFDESEDGLLVLGRSARTTEQGAAAEKAFSRGAALFPKNGALALELGKMLLAENSPRAAIAALEKIPAKAKEAKEAKALLVKARAAASEQAEASETAAALERRLNGGDAPAPGARGVKQAVAVKGEGEDYTGVGYTSGAEAGGMRTRGNRHFVFRYFNAERDFGQRAEYENAVVGALEDAYSFSKKILGEARQAPVNVILYSREEFAMHHGSGMSRMVAGFYSDNAIRMNDAAQMTTETKATLVHEYVHAAVDEFAGGSAERVPRWVNEGLAEYVEWRYLGADRPPRGLGRALQSAAMAGRLPTLRSMTDRALIEQTNPSLAYGTSAVAVKLMLKRGGVANMLGLIREVGGGASFEDVLQARYERTLERLNEEVADELKAR